ncbi:MAG: class I poly(R)-hydroxyalkanoic acid synthase [Pseudomonadota bacterium]
MTTKDYTKKPPTGEQSSENAETNLAKLNENLAKVEELSQRLMRAMQHKRPLNAALEGPGPDLMLKAGQAYWSEFLSNPGKLWEQQISLWGKTVKHYAEAQAALASGQFKAPEDDTDDDPRFRNPLWQTHPYFNFVKQQYLRNAAALRDVVEALPDLEGEDRKRLTYFTSQIVNMLSPTNFLSTNPDALERAVETDGESLVLGLENLVRDIEANGGDLVVTLADKDAFHVGENLGMTEGEVVFRNHMMELIQYTPTTPKVHETPLVIFPPWINKFYILDLKEKNSLIKWIVDQGVTLFVVSWVNPGADYSEVGLEEYINDGYLKAIETVKAIADVPKVNAVGYCIAGTTLSLTLSHLKQIGDDSVNSATFFTTLTDFSDRGEVGVFLDDDFVDGIERQVAVDGMLDSYYMTRTFSYLRSNDLIYTPAIKSYMLGESPPAFDLLYWNGDGTNLPGKMAMQYLRGLCQNDEFAQGRFSLMNKSLSLADVDVPVCAIACETDHIAAWKASYAGIQKMGSKDKTFVLSESGHIAGIVNPPSKKKYGFYSNPDLSADADSWKAAAEFSPATSWWPTWMAWLSKRSGKKVPARVPGEGAFPAIAPAPGTYVRANPKA